MTPGTSLHLCVFGGLVLFAAACSTSSSDGTAFTITSASQDLGSDPDGRTTVITFPLDLPAGVIAGNFEASGAQTATGVAIVGSTATVTWDDRVSPSDQVRLVGVVGFSAAFAGVTTTDASAPTFTSAGTQNVGAGLGLDEISVQFSGPRVVEAQAEDPSNWRLEVGGEVLDLTGSVLTLNTGTQELTFDLPVAANLHASFDLTALSVASVADVPIPTGIVTGAATGDLAAPTIVGGTAVQNLPQSEFGLVVDIQFSEPMDPVFSPRTSNFAPGFPVFASAVTQIAVDTLRVTFTGPVVPGVDTITLTGVVDAHGNAFAGGPVAVSTGSTVANAFAVNPTLTTVQNAGGDSLVATFVQALDPDDGEDPAHWSLVVDGNTIDLSTQVLSYDLSAKTLTVSLSSDFLNGDAFTFQPAGGNQPRDVDGQFFTTSFVGAVAGETAAPLVLGVTQNRSLDPAGTTLDVLMNEDVDSVQAELVGNWSVTGGINVLTATLLTSQEVVRLTLDGVAVPGDETVDAANLVDLAGNTMVAVTGLPLTSTDATPPVASSPIGRAVEGADNDTMSVLFSDDMIASEVTVAANWTFESPTGVGLDESTTVITYDAMNRSATMTFGATSGFDFKAGNDFSLTFSAMRDIAGNMVGGTTVTGTVLAETAIPLVESVFVDSAFANQIHVRFNEPCDELDDLFDAGTNPLGRTSYTVRDGSMLVRGTPQSVAIDADEKGVILTFGFVVNAGVDTLDLRGMTDLAGNPVFPVDLHTIATEESGTPVLNLGTSEFTVVSGEENDSVTVTFDRTMSRSSIFDPANYSLELAAVPVDLTTSQFTFDGDRTVTIDFSLLGSEALRTAGSYDLTVSGLCSAQGVAVSGTSSGAITSAVGSDATSPALPPSSVMVDAQNPAIAILIEMDEAIDPADAVDTSLITLDGLNPSAAVRIGPRVVRGTFASVAVGQTLNVTFRDLAGNSGLASLAVVAQDSTGPLLSSASGLAVSGLGRDEVILSFDEPVDPATALDLANYAFSQGGNAISVAGGSARYRSGTNTVRVTLPSTTDLDVALGLDVVVTGVTDASGNAISPAGNLSTSVTGDLTAPGYSSSFVNFRQEATGTVVDILFDEDVDASFAGDASQYTIGGGQTVSSVQLIRPNFARLTLSAPLGVGDDVELTGLPDHAGNASATISTVPVQ